MNIGERIKEVREERNKTLLDVATFLGVTEATVQRYESGNIKNLKLDTISKIATYLKVDPGYLMGWKDTKENIVIKSQYNFFPTSISAGLPLDIDVITENNVEKISIPDVIMGKWAGNKDVFITHINGDSMNCVIPDKSMIAVKKVELNELKNGDIVVFSHNHEYGIKRFFKFDDKLIFKPDSTDMSFTDYEIKSDNIDDLQIHGRVILYIVELD